MEFKHPFGVSSNIRKETPCVFIKIEAENRIGYGEACLPIYLGEKVEETLLFFKKSKELFRNYDPTLPLNFFLNEVDRLATGHHAAKAAIDIALHDLYGKILNKTYSQMMGIPKSKPRATSFTIGIDKEELMEQKIKEADAFSILKIKAGTTQDKELITRIRKFSDKPLYVDVNQGWKEKEFVLEMIHWMSEQNVLLIEQPMATDRIDDMAWVTEQSPIPTIADESAKRLSDLEHLEEVFSGINIKLMKCTGLREAVRMINFCKRKDLKIMLGCMAESSCATTAMAQLMQFADFVDLDAPQLYTNDPFIGLKYDKGRVVLNDLPGLGIAPNPEFLSF
ncbi:MAG: dipeptide epimerase [bacterium]|nr:dipeptide epimerase [bacterium]